MNSCHSVDEQGVPDVFEKSPGAMESRRLFLLLLRIVTVVVAVVLVVVAGILIGKVIGRLGQERSIAKVQADMARKWLRETGTLSIGAPFPDCTLFTAAGDSVRMANYLRRNIRLICVVQPGCEGCIAEGDFLKTMLVDSVSWRYVLFISTGDAAATVDFATQVSRYAQVLLDTKGIFLSHLHVNTYPFNVLISTGGGVEGIRIGGIDKDEISEIIDE